LRDKVRDQLQANGVMSMIYYPLPMHLQPVYAGLGYQVGQLPQAEAAAQGVLSLPMFPEMSEAQQDQVVAGLKGVMGELAG
jgi:dTDP-4-amino-4,6-dideoxygalactose transaminase